MTRQLWDEARHAMMGEVGFVALGVDWTQARVTHNWSLRLNTECTPDERHAVLYFIEQGLMTQTGKRYEWEVGRESGLPLMATVQDFDWADEVLHAAIGRRVVRRRLRQPERSPGLRRRLLVARAEQLAVGARPRPDETRELVADFYAQACRAWGEEPDPAVLAYATTYEGARADLKAIPAE